MNCSPEGVNWWVGLGFRSSWSCLGVDAAFVVMEYGRVKHFMFPISWVPFFKN